MRKIKPGRRWMGSWPPRTVEEGISEEVKFEETGMK